MKKSIYFLEFVLLITLLFFTSIATLSEASAQGENINSTLVEQINVLSDVTDIDKILKVIQNAHGLTYKIGSKGIGVREFQNLLISSGYSSIGKVDGVYGNKTAAAVSEFQATNDLHVTGEADLITQFYLVTHDGSFKRKRNSYIAQVKNYAVVIWLGKAFYIGSVDNSINLAEGTYYYLDGSYYGSYYEGGYKNNLRSGTGTAHFANGDVYIGQWKDDTMHGYGIYYYGGVDSDEYYKGNMIDNTMNGEGTYYLRDIEITGKWFNNYHISW